MIRLIMVFILLHVSVFALTTWPREVTADGIKLVVYQPQPESLDGNLIKARAAISMKTVSMEDPMFGAIWFEGRLHVDKTKNSAFVDSLKLTQFHFSKEDSNNINLFKKMLKKQMINKRLDISYTNLLSSLNEIKKREKKLDKAIVSVPKIFVEKQESTMVKIDGEAFWVKIEDGLEKVDNTETLILRINNKCYLYLNERTWYSAKSLKKEWKIASDVPEKVASKAPHQDALLKQISKNDNAIFIKIIIENKPSILVVYDKKPDFTPIDDTTLLYMKNTTSNLFMNVETQTYFLLESGRWYKTKELNGKWKYVDSDKLPSTFKNIPVVSEKADVRYFVAGTQEAKDAVLDAQIPQTSQIDRAKASLKVKYNGKPKLETIKGTEMQYIANTATPVIFVDKYYYACDNAVWFVSSDPDGPWKVASSIPDVIYTIPPDSFLYYVTFVHIYESDDDTVYTGYTPGYTGTYVYGTTVVYGTGFYYPYYYGGYNYYNRDLGYYALYKHNQRENNKNKIKDAIENRPKTQDIYNRAGNRDRVRQPKNSNLSGLQKSLNGKNNVFADRDGGVHKHTDKGWSSRNNQGNKNRENAGWKSAERFNGDMARRNRMDNSFSNRTRGESMNRNFSGTRGGGFNRGSMMHRGGGSRRMRRR